MSGTASAGSGPRLSPIFRPNHESSANSQPATLHPTPVPSAADPAGGDLHAYDAAAQPTEKSATESGTTSATRASTPDAVGTLSQPAATPAATSVPNPPKTNRVRWHGNADLAPSRVHAAAVAAAAQSQARTSTAATPASKTTSVAQDRFSLPASTAASAASSSHAAVVPSTTAAIVRGTGPVPTAAKTALALNVANLNPRDGTAETISPNRVIRANHPGPLMLKQRLTDTGVPGVGYMPTVDDAAHGGVIANARAPAAVDSTLPQIHVSGEDHEPDRREHQGQALASEAGMIPNPARAAAASVKPSILSGRAPVMQSPLPANLNYTAARELDERGMDEAAFQQLRAQLQLEARRGGTQARTVAGGGRAGPSRRPASTNMSSGGTSGATSGASTPYSTDSSYDPAEDSDLDHIDIIDGEVDGMPARLSKRQKQRIREQEEEERELAAENSGWSKLRKFMKVGAIKKGQDAEAEEGKGANTSSAPAFSTTPPFSGELGKYHFEGSGAGGPDDVGPTNMKSVLVTTSSGTRGGAATGLKRKPTKHERQAARLVRAHKLVSSGTVGDGGMMPALPSTNGGDLLSSFASGHRHHHHHEHPHTSDEEDTHSRSSSPDLSLDPRPLASGGVLGNLLRLYEAQKDGVSRSTSATSLVETPAALSSAKTAGAARPSHMGHSRLRTSHLASETPASDSLRSPRRPSNAGADADERPAIEDMSPEALAARALEKERKERVKEIEARLRETLGVRAQATGSRTHRRGRSQPSALAGLMSSEYKRHSMQQPRTPRRSWDATSATSSAGGTGTGTGASTAGRRPMMQSISSSTFPISAAVIEKTQQSGQQIRKVATHVAKAAASEYGFESAIDERPKAARNAGGTIGALIATTGNLVGAVSPHLAQLGPNPKRPGYTLDRYLLPEMNAKTLRQTAEIIADAAPRRSVPGTPNIWASRSAPGSPTRSTTTPSGTRSQSGSRARNTLTSSSAVALGASLASRPHARSAPSSPPPGLINDADGLHQVPPTARSASPRGSATVTAGSASPSTDKAKMGLDGAPETTAGGQPTSRAFSAGLRSMPPTPGGGLGSHLRSRSSHALSHLPGVHSAGHMLHRAWTGLHSGINTPEGDNGGMDYFSPKGTSVAGTTSVGVEDAEKLEWQRKLKRRQKKRKKEEIFITMHVAAILQRQEFLLKLARALMMFGAPTHKIESQMQHTARVLEINCRVIYLPNLMLLSFGDETTRTSETKFVKQTAGLDLTKLTDMHDIYWNVVRDKISVTEAGEQLDELMRRKPLIPRLPAIIIGGFCSAFICVGSMGFGGSFIDAVAAFPLGMFLVFCQGIITTELYSNVFEIVFCVLNSFIAAALHSTGIFCYSAVVSGSIVLLLPGYFTLCAALELQSKSLVAGSVRLVYAIIYSLFLGQGLSIGVDFWTLVRGQPLSNASYCDATRHDPTIWYRRDVGLLWALLTVPGYSVVLSLRNQAKITRKEFVAMVLIACAGWSCNHFAATARTLQGRQDITSALGSFAVGLLANLYGRFTGGRSFVVAVVGVLYQLPSGLSNGGLLNFVDTTANTDATSTVGTSTSAFSSSGFSVAASLIEVALGLTIGLFGSTIFWSFVAPQKRAASMIFSF